MLKKRPLAVACALALAACSMPALADDMTTLQNQIDALQKQMDALKAQIQQMHQQQQAAPAPSPAAAGKKGGDLLHEIVEESTFYGNFDVSLDSATKGLKTEYAGVSSPVGRVGWQADISTNLSYIGWRGKHPIMGGMDFLWQLETQVDISATSGVGDTNNAQSNQVKGGLTSRNTFIGLGGDWGAVKIGKTDAPYKTSTARMNPFSGTWGDYSVIMGNTGGDNRVEFGTRLDHSIWYESPNFGGFSFAALWSPGQNRSAFNDITASGEDDCSGGNVPGSGALPPDCNDGSWGGVYSVSGSYTTGPLYLTAAYELHSKVNRTSDTIGFPTTPAADPYGDPNDVADESAAKIGVQYVLPTKTTISAIAESMRRDVPQYLMYQNERQRTGTWLAVSQVVDARDTVSFGWAHANKAAGDPGQHNTPFQAGADNAANMLTALLKHQLDKYTWWYVDYAVTINHPWAHYDLGAGGRGVTTDCHDGSAQSGFDATEAGGGPVAFTGPHCFAGGRLQGVSAGLDFRF